MLLAIDCGNTHIVAGVYKGDKLMRHWRLNSDSKKTEDEYMILLSTLLEIEGWGISDIDAVAIASVVPAITRLFQSLTREYFNIEAFVVDSTTDTGMPVLLDNPLEVGADRIINAVAAYKNYGGPLIVVDFGTATTFDCISSAGEYLGGAIIPGMEISLEALFAKAALLSKVPMMPPKNIIGRSTAESLQVGMYWGFASQVDGIVNHLKKGLGATAKVIATGGLARIIYDFSHSIEVCDPFLTLEGLKMVYQKSNKG
ncbi:MAG: type III pantothenate kinase [Bacillota bacterium]|jgi:type III pantothenate kinase